MHRDNTLSTCPQPALAGGGQPCEFSEPGRFFSAHVVGVQTDAQVRQIKPVALQLRDRPQPGTRGAGAAVGCDGDLFGEDQAEAASRVRYIPLWIAPLFLMHFQTKWYLLIERELAKNQNDGYHWCISLR